MSRPVLNICDQTSQRAVGPTIPVLFQFSFLNTLLLPLLADADVLTRLIVTGKHAKTWIRQYAVKKSITYKLAMQLAHENRMSHLIIQDIRDVTSVDLSRFPNLLALCFHSSFDQPVPIGSLPDGLETLVFGHSFNQAINVGALPSSLTYLQLGHMFNHPLVPGAIPPNVKYLDFVPDGCFNQPLVPGSLPSALDEIIFHSYNHPLVPGVIPEGVDSVCFYGDFNHPLVFGVFPDSISTIIIASALFTYPICPGVLPRNLQYAYISEYNESFPPGCFPDSLIKLMIGDVYHQEIAVGVLPPNLTDLNLECPIHQTFVHGFLPNTLTYLQLSHFDTPIFPGVLPLSLTHLFLSYGFNQPLKPGTFPPSLVHLELSSEFDQPLLPGVLPPKLVKLLLGDEFCRPLPKGSIPSSVKYISLSKTMLFAWLPPTITHLTYAKYTGHAGSEQIFPGMVPDHITHLTLMGRVKPEFPLMPGFVPSSVTHLSLLLYDDNLCDPDVGLDELIPNTVQHLAFLHHPTRPIPRHIQTEVKVGYQKEDNPIFYDPDNPLTFVFPVY